MVKTDAAGNFQWGWLYGDVGVDEGRSVLERPGGYVVFGSTTSYGAGGWDHLLFSTDPSGTLLAASTIGTAGNEGDPHPIRMEATSDGGSVIASRTGNDVLVVKLDASTNVTWAKTYGTGIGSAIAETPTGYFVMGTNYEEFLLSLDAGGNLLWARKYGDVPFQNFVVSLSLAADNAPIAFAPVPPLGVSSIVSEAGTVVQRDVCRSTPQYLCKDAIVTGGCICLRATTARVSRTKARPTSMTTASATIAISAPRTRIRRSSPCRSST